MRQLAALALVLSLAGCGDDDDAPSPMEAMEACHDLADWFGTAAVRCGYTYQEGYGLVVGEDGKNCDNVTSLRDRDAFYSGCKAWVQTLPCDMLANGITSTPPSCKDQF